MKLLSNWRAVIRHAWCLRLIVLCFVLNAMEVSVPLLHGLLPVPQGAFALLAGLSSAGAFLARLLVQRELHQEERQ